MKYAWLILMFYVVQEIWCEDPPNKIKKDLLKMMVDIIKDTNTRIGHLSEISQTCGGKAAFEVGYLMYGLLDKYRRMVDRYHTTRFMRRRLFVNEYVLMLVEVELHYWEIEHIGNMLHEIERKYSIKGDLDQDYELPPTTTASTAMTRPTYSFRTRSKTKKKHFNMYKYVMSKLESTVTKQKKKKWWPIEYGTTSALCLSDFQNKIINEVSWPIKLKLLKDYKGDTKQSAYRRVGIQAYRMEKILRDDDVEITTGLNHDESNMKMKLFRLMYETIRDSDVKIKRAEVIKRYYTNSTSFNLGYMMGEITERFNVMREIAATMKRLYAEWKPMEHINAYEQVANKAVELCTMVDVAKSMLKKDANYTANYRHRH